MDEWDFSLEQYIYEIILLSAFLHASWNAMMKFGAAIDPYAKTVMLNGVGAVIALPMMFYVGLPSASAYYFLVPSVAVGLGYTTGLMWSYKFGDMSQVYPLVRGAGVLFATLIATAVFHEKLGVIGWVGVVVLAVGVLLLSARGKKITPVALNSEAVAIALFTGAMLGLGLTLDGMGARKSGSPHAYTAMLFVGLGASSIIGAFALRGPRLILADVRRNWRIGVLAGTIAFFVYWVFVWAATVTPIPVAAALRDTSVLIGAIIGVIWFGESLRPVRIFAAMTILAGLVLLRFQAYESRFFAEVFQ